jgi:hypothetical protein
MKINYNPEISLGSVLQIIAIIGSVFSAYIALKTTDIEMGQRLEVHDQRIAELKETQKINTEKAYLEIKELGINVKSLDMRVTQWMLDQTKEIRSIAAENSKEMRTIQNESRVRR